jgi:hyperosmotically inducible protein
MKVVNIFKLSVLAVSMSLSLNLYAASMNASDTSIVANIQHHFAAEQATSGVNVTILSHDGVVTLAGKVDTDGEASKLIQIAESTHGVKDVNGDSLQIKESKQPYADTAITAKVKGTFIREKLFGDKDVAVMGVTVETTNGVVYLTGDVADQAQADNAIKLAKSVKGVKSVESKLIVKPA